MINPLSASQVYTQNLDTKSTKVEKEVKTNKVENTRTEEIKKQVANGDYKIDLKATASKIYEALI